MGKQIIKQPDGRYCEYSSIRMSIISCNHTRETYIEKETKKFTAHLSSVLDMVDKGKAITMNPVTFEQALKITEKHSPDDYAKIIKILKGGE